MTPIAQLMWCGSISMDLGMSAEIWPRLRWVRRGGFSREVSFVDNDRHRRCIGIGHAGCKSGHIPHFEHWASDGARFTMHSVRAIVASEELKG